MVLKLEDASESPGELVKWTLLSPTSRVFDSAGPGWSLKTCISKFPDDAEATGPGTTLWESLPYKFTNSTSRLSRVKAVEPTLEGSWRAPPSAVTWVELIYQCAHDMTYLAEDVRNCS